MGPQRPGKRVRSDDLFFEDSGSDGNGSYLRIRLLSGKSIKSKGWPWVQLGVRGILGITEKLEKANFLSDGGLLVKTKTKTQTDKILKTHKLANEECEVICDQRLNQSRGMIKAWDLLDPVSQNLPIWVGNDTQKQIIFHSHFQILK